MANILHVIESLEFGGAEKVVVHLANSFFDEHNVFVCATKRFGELRDQLHPDIQVFCLSGKEGNDLSVTYKILNILKEYNIDILQCHDWGVYLESVLASIIYGKSRVIHTVHGDYMPYRSGVVPYIKKSLRHLIEYLFSYKVFKIVPVSRSILDGIRDDIHIPLSKFMVIHNGIPGNSHKKYTCDKETPVKLITVGRLAPVKNHKMMLDAIACVLSKGYKIQLTIVGDGPEYEKLVAYSNASGINEYVEFCGFRNDIDKLLSSNDIFLLSSDYEGISIALLESMSTGLPSIATDVGGIPDTIQHNQTGILVEKDNYQSMCNAIIYFIENNEKLVEMGNCARDYFCKNFHESVVLENYRQLYFSCLK